jgi:hypothetical protein
MARPRKRVDEKLLGRMVAEGLRLKQIAKLLEISQDTLIRNFAKIIRPTVHDAGGRPRKPIDPKKVQKLIAIGLSAEEIGALLDVSGDTILRRFEEELKIGIQKRNACLKSELFRRATVEKSDAALIFALKSWCGMSDRPTAENSEPRNWFYETVRLQRELIAAQRQNVLPSSPSPSAFAGIEFDPTDADLDSDIEPQPVPTPQAPVNDHQLPVPD